MNSLTKLVVSGLVATFLSSCASNKPYEVLQSELKNAKLERSVVVSADYLEHLLEKTDLCNDNVVVNSFTGEISCYGWGGCLKYKNESPPDCSFGYFPDGTKCPPETCVKYQSVLAHDYSIGEVDTIDTHLEKLFLNLEDGKVISYVFPTTEFRDLAREKLAEFKKLHAQVYGNRK